MILKILELDITLKIHYFWEERAKMAENDWKWKEMLLVGDMVSSAAGIGNSWTRRLF